MSTEDNHDLVIKSAPIVDRRKFLTMAGVSVVAAFLGASKANGRSVVDNPAPYDYKFPEISEAENKSRFTSLVLEAEALLKRGLDSGLGTLAVGLNSSYLTQPDATPDRKFDPDSSRPMVFEVAKIAFGLSEAKGLGNDTEVSHIFLNTAEWLNKEQLEDGHWRTMVYGKGNVGETKIPLNQRDTAWAMLALWKAYGATGNKAYLEAVNKGIAWASEIDKGRNWSGKLHQADFPMVLALSYLSVAQNDEKLLDLAIARAKTGLSQQDKEGYLRDGGTDNPGHLGSARMGLESHGGIVLATVQLRAAMARFGMSCGEIDKILVGENVKAEVRGMVGYLSRNQVIERGDDKIGGIFAPPTREHTASMNTGAGQFVALASAKELIPSLGGDKRIDDAIRGLYEYNKTRSFGDERPLELGDQILLVTAAATYANRILS